MYLKRSIELTEIYPKFAKPPIQKAGPKNIQHNAFLLDFTFWSLIIFSVSLYGKLHRADQCIEMEDLTIELLAGDRREVWAAQGSGERQRR